MAHATPRDHFAEVEQLFSSFNDNAAAALLMLLPLQQLHPYAAPIGRGGEGIQKPIAVMDLTLATITETTFRDVHMAHRSHDPSVLDLLAVASRNDIRQRLVYQLLNDEIHLRVTPMLSSLPVRGDVTRQIQLQVAFLRQMPEIRTSLG